VSKQARRPVHSQGDDMLSNATLELIASLIAKGQARVIRKGGKLMVVSPL
jgi:hypothetical protein